MDNKPSRRWFRFAFGLRTLLVLVTVAAALTAWIANERRKSQHEQKIAEQLQALGAADVELRGVCYSEELELDGEPQGWWRELAEQVVGRRIITIRIRGTESTFEDLTLIASLSNLQCLDLYKTNVSDLAPLAELTNLQAIGLKFASVNDLRPLAGLKNLQELNVSNTSVSDLTPLVGLKNLHWLVLNDTRVSDFTPLASLTGLQVLYLSGTHVSIEQVQMLQKALPDCDINY